MNYSSYSGDTISSYASGGTLNLTVDSKIREALDNHALADLSLIPRSDPQYLEYFVENQNSMPFLQSAEDLAVNIYSPVLAEKIISSHDVDGL